MVFAPTRDFNIGPHDPAAIPRRVDHVAPRAPDPNKRMFWRAVVVAGDRDTAQTAWHLAACTAPFEPSAHCPEGQRLLEQNGDPDGHCLVDNDCQRCALAN
jgi:hypothetical protein